MPRSIVLFSLFLIMTMAPAAVSAQTVLLDTYDTGTVGMAPGFPEVGFSSFSLFGSTTLIDPLTDGNLRARCNDDAANDGCRFTYSPTGPSESAETYFTFRVESGAVASGGANDFDQQLILLPGGTNLSLEWSAFIGQLGVRIFAGGGEIDQFFVPGFQWLVDTDYEVVIGTDATTNSYTVSVNGNLLVDEGLGADFTALNSMSLRSGFAATGVMQVDDVEIIQVPEPGAWASSMAALCTVFAVVRTRTRRTARG